MMRRWTGLATLIAAIAQPIAAQSAAAQTANVSIVATTRDDLGRRLAARVRQKVAANPLMSYVSSDTVSSLRLRLVTLDPDPDTSQNMTVYTQVLVLHPADDGLETYLSSHVGTCGTNKIEQCADSIVADLDEWGEALRKMKTK